MSEFIASTFLVLGSAFMLLAGLGVLRMPDLFTRMQTATKAATLGVGFTLTGTAIYFNQLGVTTRAVLIIAFVFLTAPVAAHVVARAAYSLGVPFWKGMLVDELDRDGVSSAHTNPGPVADAKNVDFEAASE